MWPGDRNLVGIVLRPGRIRGAVQPCSRRRFATEFASSESSSSSSSSLPPISEFEASNAKEQKGKTAEANARKEVSLFVRPWERISSMPELFAMIRGLERKFGKIREYSIGRDQDVPSMYNTYFLVHFADPASLQRVPEQSSTLKLEVPVVDAEKSGGIGLEDLHGLLQSQDYAGPEQFDGTLLTKSEEMKTRMVDLRIERSRTRIRLEAQEERGAGRKKASYPILNEFYNWGGFHTPTPDEPAVYTRYLRQGKLQWAATSANWKKRPDRLEHDTSKHLEEEELLENSNADDPISDDLNHTVVPVEERTLSLTETPASASSLTETATRFAEVAPKIETAPADASASEAEMPAVDGEIPAPGMSKPKGPSRRERILELARQHARTPLPDAVKATAEERKEAKRLEREREKEEEERVKVSMRDRLWKLMGGRNWL